MRFIVDGELFEKVPQLKVGCLRIKGVSNIGNSDRSYQFLCEHVDQARKNFVKSGKVEHQNLTVWKEAFERLEMGSGRVASHVALFERILDRQELPNINSIVNLTNGISIEHVTPFGAHDLAGVEGDITVGRNRKSLNYTTMDGKSKEAISPDEVVYADEKGVMTRGWIQRQSSKTMVTEQTTEIFIPIDIIGIADDQIVKIAQEAVEVLRVFCTQVGEVTFELVDKDHQSVELDQMPELPTSDALNLEAQKHFANTNPIDRDQKVIDRIIQKASDTILPSIDALEKALKSGRKLKVYQGFDPTADTLHVGHIVGMRKLEDFRRLGHKVYFLIGDFTARIGDPTDKAAARVKLTPEQIKVNLAKYVEQAKSVVDIDNAQNPVTVVFNNDWLGKMDFSDVLELCSEFTVQQMIKRDMFQKRLQEDKPIYIHEFLYPLMQGFDSVAMEVDIEVGGNDQLFNMLAGRQLVGDHLLKEKFVISAKLLETPDGKKMGKSEGNMVKLSDTAKEIYGKIMSLPDQFIVGGMELLTGAEMEEVEQTRKLLESGTNPIELKKQLAYLITREHKGEEAAREAEQHFFEVYQKGTFDTDIEQFEVQVPINICQLLVDSQIASSKSAARRLVEQGAVTLGQTRIKSWTDEVTPEDQEILKVGRKVIKLKV